MPAHCWRALPVVLVCLLVAGCASAPKDGGVYDPLEPINRKIYAFNDKFDRAIARPVARAYDKVVPKPVDQGITNFFNNLGDVGVLINSMLQLKVTDTVVTAYRLVVNSTVGIYGLIDVVGMMGGEKRNEDFGQTLGSWGVGRGPYLVLPFLGPSNVRDTTGFVVDNQYYSPINEFEPESARNQLRLLDAIDTRAGLLGATDVLDTAAVDPYVFTREAFTARRARQVHDGDPPPEALPGNTPAEGEEAFDPFSDEDDDLFEEPPADGG